MVIQYVGQTPAKEEIGWFTLNLVVFVQEQLFWETMIPVGFASIRYVTLTFLFTHTKAMKGWDYITGDTGEWKGKQSYRNWTIRTNRSAVLLPKGRVCSYVKTLQKKVVKIAYIIMFRPLGRQRKRCLDLHVRQAVKYWVGRHHWQPSWSHGFTLKRRFCKLSPFQEMLLKSSWLLPWVLIYRARHIAAAQEILYSLFIETAVIYINWTKSTLVTFVTGAGQTIHYELHVS